MNAGASLDDRILGVVQRVRVVDTECVPFHSLAGRILAQDVLTDRASPPCDVSAMDGYAIRLPYLSMSEVPIAGVNFAGRPSSPWIDGQALKVFTGAPVPPQADCVIRREDTVESPASFRFCAPIKTMRKGENIRYCGENVGKGMLVLRNGTSLSAAQVASLATFGPNKVEVRRRLRVAILTTGDELVAPGQPVEAWQIRDSNGPFLQSFLGQYPWIESIQCRRIEDRLDSLVEAIREMLNRVDAIVMSGGVSKGDSDYVPAAVMELGANIEFHGLPIRPGKPILAATWSSGQLVLGLPGNPLSVAVTARRFALPLLKHMAGCPFGESATGTVTLVQADEKTIPLTWFRLVQRDGTGYRLVASQGSGDVVSLGRSDGFVEIPPTQSGLGPWSYYAW